MAALTVALPEQADNYNIAAGGGFVWVQSFQHVYRIDPVTNRATAAVTVSHGTQGGIEGAGPPCVGEVAYGGTDLQKQALIQAGATG